MKKLFTILCILTLLAPSAIAAGGDKTEDQIGSEPFKTQYTIGLNGMVEASLLWMPMMGGRGGSSGASFNYGVSFEARMTRHSGIETGLYCRTMNFPGYQTWADWDPSQQVYYARSYGRYLSIPLLYKFYSRVLNFAVGFNYDILIDERQRHSGFSPLSDFGVQLKVTKDIKLYRGLIIEPFVMANHCLTGEADRTWFGAGFGVKYRF